jgi:hypothetical protein
MLAHQGLRDRGHTQVAGKTDHIAFGVSLHRRHRVVHRGGGSPADDHGSAFACERGRDGIADARGGTGDQRNFFR